MWWSDTRLVSNKKNYIIIFISSLIVSIFCSYIVSSLTVVPDESAYWAGASALTGNKTDAFGSWTLGYSFFIWPAFYFFDSYDSILIGVKLINSIIYAFNVVLIFKLYDVLFDNGYIKSYQKFIPILFSIYPFYIIISGYVMSENVFSLVFLFLNIVLVKFHIKNSRYLLLLLSLLTALLYIVNPKAIVIFIAITLTLFSSKQKPYDVIFFGIIYFFSLYIYREFEAILHSTASLGDIKLHYPHIGELFSVLLDYQSVKDLFLRFSGQSLYLTLSTGGLFVIGMMMCFLNLYRGRRFNYYYLFLFLSVFGTQILTAMMFSLESEAATRLDHFMYGRYIEPLIAPIMILGFDAFFSKKRITNRYISSSLVVVIIMSIYFYFVFDSSWGFSYVNSSSFWFYYFFDKTFDASFLIFPAALYTILLLINNKKIVISIIFASFVVSLSIYMNWHAKRSKQFSGFDNSANLIRNKAVNNTCVLYNTSGIKNIWDYMPFYHLSWRLINYSFVKGSINNAESNCSHFYFSNIMINEVDIRRSHVIRDWYLYEKDDLGLDKWTSPILFEYQNEWLHEILKVGWYPMESNYFWSKPKAFVNISRFNNVSHNSNVTFDVRPFGLDNKYKSIDFTCGSYTSSKVLKANVDAQVTIPIKSCDVISIDVTNAESPKELGVNSDTRQLGIMLKGITFN
ncbi:hypothetical protein R3X26_07290 [Vibrio sp. TH_r3]|uniref:hypothetical protein n=1 Tax=Vibrio sp. TH_r3 TaxID=3082084 RepID=UPI0029551816|nr:hypothetical protein [Vibrio sp. TH_r3]MDV7104209.1 hypothetical protein [Vibrio sp. TH_r3]